MARPKNIRSVHTAPKINYFKPRGVPLSELGEVILAVDELESLRLADLEGLDQKSAADEMNVSRATFGRIVNQARKSVAKALIEGKSLKIEGGNYSIATGVDKVCTQCKLSVEKCEFSKPACCPKLREDSNVDSKCNK